MLAPLAQVLNVIAQPNCRPAHFEDLTMSSPDSDLAESIARQTVSKYIDQGTFEEAIKQALHLCDTALEQGPPYLSYCLAMDLLGQAYRAKGDLHEAAIAYSLVLGFVQKFLGEDRALVAGIQHKLANVDREMGNFKDAEPLYLSALDFRRRSLPEYHPDIVLSLNNLGELYRETGDYKQAERHFSEALRIVRSSPKANEHPHLHAVLNNLGLVHLHRGKYAKAVPFFRETLDIDRRAGKEKEPQHATLLSNLAGLHVGMGDYSAAEPLLREALDLFKQTKGESHGDFAVHLNNLASVYLTLGKYADAEQLLRQALDTVRRTSGEDHPDFRVVLGSLALLYIEIGKHNEAEPLLRQIIENGRRNGAENHPHFAVNLRNLATVCEAKGNFGEAEQLRREALQIVGKALGEDHPDIATGLRELASLHAATGRAAEALALMERANAIDDMEIGQVFSVASEAQRMIYLEQIRLRLQFFLSLVWQYFRESPPAVRAALELVLRRKCIGAEALAVQRDSVLGGKYPLLVPKLNELTRVRWEIAQRSLAGPGAEGLQCHQGFLNQINQEFSGRQVALANRLLQLQEHKRTLTELNDRKSSLEAELAREIPELSLEQKLRIVNCRDVMMTLPKDAALVELVRFNVFDFDAAAKHAEAVKPARYLAFVLLAGESAAVRMIDLREAERIDKLVSQVITSIDRKGKRRGFWTGLRSFLFTPIESLLGRRTLSGQSVEAEAELEAGESRAILRAAVFDPLVEFLGGRTRLFLAPDGELTRLPFEVLPTTDGGHLIDSYAVSYLTCGRDILRFGVPVGREFSEPLVVAAPDYDLKGDDANTASTLAGKPLLRTEPIQDDVLHFVPLDGTRVEGERIADMLHVWPWVGADALKTRVKARRSPRLLHFATHGYFLPDPQRDVAAGFRITTQFLSTPLSLPHSQVGVSSRVSGPGMTNPLLRSWLALAGANSWLSGGAVPPEAEDGLLTAEDVSGMDLQDTQLVVLSACDTGVGEIRVGEGVFGLRRAFVVAGARALVMSLWKVPDAQTCGLMIDFYGRLLAGEEASTALRGAQLEMKKRYPDPYFWGAFICQGRAADR
jgi:tetratricopeptide (TPR) repeat protein